MVTWKEQKNIKQSPHKAQTENTKYKQGASQLPPEKENKVTVAFQGGAFSPFPPGSNCLFSSLMVLRLRFAGVAAVPAGVPTCSVGEEMSANVVVLLVVPTRSVGEEMFSP